MSPQTCGAIPRPTRKLDETYTVEPAQDGERSVELRRVGNNQAIMMAWHAPALSHPDSAALEVLGGIMSGGGGRGGGGTGRLYKALVDNKKALSVRMGYEELHDPGFVLVSATLSKDQSLDDARKTILDTMAGVVDRAAHKRGGGTREGPNPPGHGAADDQLPTGRAGVIRDRLRAATGVSTFSITTRSRT